jgi:quercetin dioxygenase-like cupin family protein
LINEVVSDKAESLRDARRYRFSELKEEWLNEKLSRRLVVGENEMLGYFTLKKGCVVPAHKHVSEQMSVILKGALAFTIAGAKTVVKEGEVLVIPPNVEHEAVAVEDTVVLDCFSPIRDDWLKGQDQYLRGAPSGSEQIGPQR